jgi:hypothetical protein
MLRPVCTLLLATFVHASTGSVYMPASTNQGTLATTTILISLLIGALRTLKVNRCQKWLLENTTACREWDALSAIAPNINGTSLLSA